MLFVAFFVIIFRFLIVDVFTFAFVLMFVGFLGIVRTEAFGADKGRQMFNVGNRILSSLVESQGIGVELLQAVEKVEQVAGTKLLLTVIKAIIIIVSNLPLQSRR